MKWWVPLINGSFSLIINFPSVCKELLILSGEVHHSLSAHLVHHRHTFSRQEIYFFVCLHYVAAYDMKASPPLLAFLLVFNPAQPLEYCKRPLWKTLSLFHVTLLPCGRSSCQQINHHPLWAKRCSFPTVSGWRVGLFLQNLTDRFRTRWKQSAGFLQREASFSSCLLNTAEHKNKADVFWR